MKISITINNISNYSNTNDKFYDITEIDWNAGKLDKKVIDNFPNLRKLNCNTNEIISLEPLSNCVNLQSLDCSYNFISSLEPLSNCSSLEILNCNYNNMELKSLKGLSKCTNLRELYCHDNIITSLKPLSNCVNLQVLDCSWNSIKSIEPLSACFNLLKLDCSLTGTKSFESLSNCANIQELHCIGNQIESLETIQNFPNLKILFCDDNKIVSFQPLSNCPNLKELYCSENQIKSLESLSNCSNIQVLHCSDNQIDSLETIHNFPNLKNLHCDRNEIVSLEPLSNCPDLEKLNCTNNQITSLEPLIYLRRLNNIQYTNNPIEMPTVQIQRMLNRIITNHNSSIYNDKQNVHDAEIQKNVCESIQKLLKDPKNNFSIDDIVNSSLNKITIESLIEYCQDQTIHSIHLITYEELLSLVWNRINQSVHKSELLKILEEQIADAECMCFTGRFNRTLSVLVGFFDDIQINISDKSRISAIILNSKNKIFPYDASKHKDLARKELIKAGYQEADFNVWIDAIDE